MHKKRSSIPIIYYFIFFLIAQLLLLLFLRYEKIRDEKGYANLVITSRQNEYRAILSSYDRLVHTIFAEVINKPAIISLLKESYPLNEDSRRPNRAELYEKLLPAYQRLGKNIVRQLHFHFPDGTSFLRMHKPEAFGDKLFAVRESVRIVNTEKRVVEGFEEGRHYHAFRHVFPLSLGGDHVGSVGISVPFYNFKRSLVDAFPAEYFFIIKKSVVEQKLFLKERSNYATSSISPDFLVEKADLAEHICQKGHKNCFSTKLINKIDKEIEKGLGRKLAGEVPFVKGGFIHGDYYFATFIPVKNVKGKVVGFLYSYFKDSSMPAFQFGYYITYCIATMLIIFLLCLYRWSTNTIISQNSFLYTTIESIPYPFYVIDVKDHSILLANSLAGLEGNWHGKKCYQHTHNNETPCDGSEHICPLHEVVESKKSIVVEHRHITGNGAEKIVEVYGSPIFDKENNVVQIIEFCVDVTERKLAEDTRQKLESNLRQARKMEAVGTMAGGVAHHFNNILGSILGFAELAQADMPKDSQAFRDMDRVVGSANRAKNLVRHIVSISSHNNSQDERCRPDKLIYNFFSSNEFELPANILLEKDIEPSEYEICLNYYHLKKIMSILVDNALNAMSGGAGTLGISLRSNEVTDAEISGNLGVDVGRFVNLTVSDTGCGIPEKDLERIFDPFFTTKEVGQGEGIGLAILQGIVMGNGGMVKVVSEVGRGARFDIFLPMAKV